MVLIVLCIAGYILAAFLVTYGRRKKLGSAVLVTHSEMSSRELLSVIFRSILTVVVAVIMRREHYIENIYYLTAVLCFVAMYAGYLLFPVLCSYVFKRELGVYENGVFTYGGVLKYKDMKEYVINRNKNPGGQNMTVYCKSMFPVALNIRHFDVDNRQAKVIDSYFKKKHKQFRNADNGK